MFPLDPVRIPALFPCADRDIKDCDSQILLLLRPQRELFERAAIPVHGRPLNRVTLLV